MLPCGRWAVQAGRAGQRCDAQPGDPRALRSVREGQAEAEAEV